MKVGEMMKVVMKVSIASPDWSYAPGDIADLDEDIATKFINNGFSELIEQKTTKRGGKNADNSTGN